jgi:hypothetical protein
MGSDFDSYPLPDFNVSEIVPKIKIVDKSA